MKNLIIPFLTFISLATFSQSLDNPINRVDWQEAPSHNSIRSVKSSSNVSRSSISQWINFVDATSNYYASTPDYDYYFLFPDTSVVAEYSTSFGISFIHSFAMTFDLSSPVINSYVGTGLDEFDINQNSFIDTIATYGRYTKGSAGYVDTLIFRVIPRSGLNLNIVGMFTGQLTKYPTSNDTARYRRIYLDTNTMMPFGVAAEYKVPILLGDTISNGLQYTKAAIPGGLGVPSIFAVTVSYKPGGYNPYNDTMGRRIGSYTQIVAEHNGDGTYHNYLPGDYTGSATVHRSVRYNYSTTGWNGRHIPYLAYGATQFEAVDIDLYIRQTNNISIDESTNGARILQSFPNPSNGITTISYSLEKASSIQFSLIDATGKQVLSINEGNMNQGKHSLNFNTSSLKSGVYFYSLIVNGEKITKKLIVTK